MKKQVLVLALALGLAVVAALAFLLLRAERTIRRQQTSLTALSARVDLLERNHADAETATATAGPAQPNQNTFDFALSPDPTVETEMEDLRAKNADLQSRLESLEKQKPSPTLAFPGVFGNGNDNENGQILPGKPKLNMAPGEQVPNNWVPFQFNGMTYYKVPLAARD